MESFPPNRVTPYGIKMLRDGAQPLITYTSPEGDLIFYVNGGLAPFPGVTEGVILTEGMDGLHPPFNHLDHKGARQSGVSYADTVYDPSLMVMKVTCHGNSPQGLKRIIRKWVSAWDPKNPGTLSWVTPEMGQWTCKVRLAKAPPEKIERAYAQRKQQSFTWTVRNDGAFWVGPNSISQLGVEFDAAVDDFYRDDNGTLGTNWTQTYTGPGGGVCTTEATAKGHGRARWTANDPDTTFTGRRSVVAGPFRDFVTSTDTQLISITVNNTPEFTPGVGAANHMWGRMGRNVDGTWNGYGVRATVGWGFCQISAFKNFVETVLDREFVLVPPVAGESFVFEVGNAANPGHYALKRDGNVIVNFDDTGLTAVNTGVNYRGVGFGLSAGGAILTQATPAQLRSISAGDNGSTPTLTLLDTFGTDTNTGLGNNWPLYYTGTGPGYVRAHDGHSEWVDVALGRSVYNRWLGANEVQTITLNGSPISWNLTFLGSTAAGVSQTTASLPGTATAAQVQSALEALAAIQVGDVTVTGGSGVFQVEFKNTFKNKPMATMKAAVLSGPDDSYVTVAETIPGASQTTSSDNQVIAVELGTLFHFPFPHAAFINVFGRMNDNDATPTGMCLQIGPQWVALFSITAGVWKQVAYKALFLPPSWNEKWTFTCGTVDNPLRFLVQRNGSKVIDWTDKKSLTVKGATYRNSGFGMDSGDGVFAQAIPPAINKWSMADNAGITQSGHLTLTNFGDQQAYPDYLVYGPGTFTFGDGPGATPTVKFGPLTDGQVALIRTDPSLRGVFDLSTEAATVTLEGYAEFAQQLRSLATNGNINPLMDWFKSEFGVTPDQGNLYSLLQGRFSQPIQATPTVAPSDQQIAVDITGAGVTTRVVGVVTPLRRWPE